MIHFLQHGHWPKYRVSGIISDWGMWCERCNDPEYAQELTRVQLLLIAVITFAVNLPIAWILALAGNGLAAVMIVTIGNVIIWWVAWRLEQ